METKVYINKNIYQCAKDHAESIGLSYSAFVNKIIIAELSRRNKLHRKGYNIITVKLHK